MLGSNKRQRGRHGGVIVIKHEQKEETKRKSRVNPIPMIVIPSGNDVVGPMLVRATPARVRHTQPRKTLKGMDTDLTDSDIKNDMTNNEDIGILNLIRSGTAYYNRVGRRVKLKSVTIQANISWKYKYAGTTETCDGNILRIAIVWDKRPGDAPPAKDDIFGSVDQAGVKSSNWSSPINFDQSDRFRVLQDKCWAFNPSLTPGSGGTGDSVTYHKCVTLKHRFRSGGQTYYSGDTSPMTLADISTGALYAVVMAETYISGQNHIALKNTSSVRLRYEDLAA